MVTVSQDEVSFISEKMPPLMGQTSNHNNSYSDDRISLFLFHDSCHPSINYKTNEVILEMPTLSKPVDGVISSYSEDT